MKSSRSPDHPLTPPLPTIRSQRAAEVARRFGLTDQLPETPPERIDPPWIASIVPKRGQITLLTGPSGAGKSTVLQCLRKRRRGRYIDLDRLEPPDLPLVDCFADLPLDQTLKLLSRVGLGEAWSYLRTPAELSEGQRWRLKLALALHRPKHPLLLADEFAALLDRITARIVARCLRQWIDRAGNLRAVVATSHTDLAAALQPDTVVTCDFDRVSIQSRGPDDE